jgi:hypothetical protein
MTKKSASNSMISYLPLFVGAKKYSTIGICGLALASN